MPPPSFSAPAANPPGRLPPLHPRAGRRLHRSLRARRIHRLAETLPGGLAGADFEQLLGRIDGAPPVAGNRARAYFLGEEAFAAMHQAIGEARQEVLLESYIFKDDATGRRLGEALVAAAARGARVRVLVDALGSLETAEHFWDGLRRAGIEVRHFHPLLSRFTYHLYRDHRKILVADRRVAFTGGMNVADEYGASVPSAGSGWRDSHVRVEGPVVLEMASVFAEGWARAGGDALPEVLMGGGGRPVGEARALVLEHRPNRGHRESAAVMAAIVAAARRNVWITNAYFAPARSAVDILGRAAARGVDVRLLLPGETDVPLVRHAGHGYFATLLDRGVRVFEYQGSILHAKSVVADGRVAVIGSTNLDFRSFQFNAECNLVLLDPETAEDLERAFGADLERSVEIDRATWSRRPFRHRLGDRLARLLSPLL